MAVGPLYYSLYDAACVVVTEAFSDAGKTLKQTNIGKLSPAEVEDLVRLLMEANGQTVWSTITAHLRAGVSIRSLADTIQIGAAELILRTTVPRKFTEGQHPFDYCNTANYWMRGSDNPYQARILYLMSSFVNDAARANKLFSSLIEQEFADFDLRDHSTAKLLRDQDEAIMAFDIGRSTAVANAYLQSGADRTRLLETIAVTACKFQDDPHNQKISHSTFEEYQHNTTHLRDRLLLASARLLAGWPKMPGDRECYARFTREWINN
jgi:hypothetical protein